MLDYLIKGGLIVDGTGKKPYVGDVGVKNGKIASIGCSLNEDTKKVIQAKGKYVTPGFIDVHRHADANVFLPQFGEIEVRQGLTTIVNGNCGLSIIPCPKERKEEIFDFLKAIIGEVTCNDSFEDYASYMQALRKQKLPINVGMLLGDGTVRAAVKGYDTGKLSKQELEKARAYISDSLEAGALGVSLGIVYAPEYNYNLDDFVEVLQPMKKFNVPLVTHIRGEGDIFKESIEEVIEIARRLNVPLHISHLKCIGKRNWGHGVDTVLSLIENARLQGMDVTCDVYPYTAGSTQLIQVLPPQYLEGGFHEITKRLQDQEQRENLTHILKSPSATFENLVSSIGWENIRVTTVQTEKNKVFVGKSIEEIARIQKKDSYECAYDLLIEENCNVAMIDFITAEEDIKKIMKYPFTNIISDSVYPTGGVPHPRMYGTFPKILEKYVREEAVLPIEEAVYKMTGLPAKLYQMNQKGEVKQGMDADLLIFDLNKITTKANYDNPRCLATGFSYIFVNGSLAVKDDVYLNTKTGQVLSMNEEMD
ncbi:MAG: amidohydrolase family protein [Velocimicrobium sp.]